MLNRLKARASVIISVEMSHNIKVNLGMQAHLTNE